MAGATVRAGRALLATRSLEAAGIVARGGVLAQAGQRSVPVIKGAVDKLNSTAVANFGGTAQQWAGSAMSHGQRFIDTAHRGNVSYFLARPDGGAGFIRVTLDPTSSRVISGGMVRGKQLQDWVASGRLVP